jgi:hypothetical protein
MTAKPTPDSARQQMRPVMAVRVVPYGDCLRPSSSPPCRSLSKKRAETSALNEPGDADISAAAALPVPTDATGLHVAPHESHHVGLSRVGNSVDQPTHVADICIDSVASLIWPRGLISGSWCPVEKSHSGTFELKLIEDKRGDFCRTARERKDLPGPRRLVKCATSQLQGGGVRDY